MVYVDNAQIGYGRMKMNHMIADTLEELHSMADRLGLRREWFQAKSIPHYDICKAKRAQAIELGARAVTSRELVKIARANKEENS